MKKNSIPIAIMLLALSITSSAQLNYLFSAGSKPNLPIVAGLATKLIMVAPSDASPPRILSGEGLAQLPISLTFNYNAFIDLFLNKYCPFLHEICFTLN